MDKVFPYFTLQLMTRGAVAFRVGDQPPRTLEGAWAWSAFPGPRTRFHPAGPAPWNHRYAAFAGLRAERWAASGLFPRQPRPVPPALLPRLRRAFDAVLGHVEAGTPWDFRLAANAVERVLLLLAQDRAAPPLAAAPTRLRPVLARLADALGPEPDLAAEAAALHMGLTTLRRGIVQATGFSPHAYRLHHRVLAARGLLTGGDRPLKEIADLLGYHDVQHFSRHFRTATGSPPGLYRASRST